MATDNMYENAKQSKARKNRSFIFLFARFLCLSLSLSLFLLYKITNFIPADSLYEAFGSFIDTMKKKKIT